VDAAPAGTSPTWSCLLIKIPAVEVGALAIAWAGSGDLPLNQNTWAGTYGDEEWHQNQSSEGTAHDNTWRMLIYSDGISMSLADIDPEDTLTFADCPCTFSVLGWKGGDDNTLSTSTAPLGFYPTRTTVVQSSLAGIYAGVRLVGAGMTVTFDAPALADQGAVYGVDSGRLFSGYRDVKALWYHAPADADRLEGDGNSLAGTEDDLALSVRGLALFNRRADPRVDIPWIIGVSPSFHLQPGFILANQTDGNQVWQSQGLCSWWEDAGVRETYRQADVTSWKAKHGSYSVLYPRDSEHPYIPISQRGPLFVSDDSSTGVARMQPVLRTHIASGSGKQLLLATVDPTWGTKAVRYSGMSSAAQLRLKTVSRWECLVDPSGPMNGFVTGAWSHDPAAERFAMAFASSLPVMYPAADNDWAGFWKKVGSVVSKLPGWLNNNAIPWVKGMGQAVSNAISTGKQVYSDVTGAL